MNKNIENLYQDGKVDQAIHLLIADIDKDPKDTENYLTLSTYLIEQGEAEQAKQLLEKATGLVKNPKELYYNLAVCYYANGEFKKSIQLLDQIENDDLTLYQKALVYLKTGQSQKALAYALTIKKVDDRVKELIGDIWLSLGDLNSAYQSYLSIEEKERSAKVNFLLGISIFNSNLEKAKEYFAKSKKLDPKYYQTASSQYNDIMRLINQGKKDD